MRLLFSDRAGVIPMNKLQCLVSGFILASAPFLAARADDVIGLYAGVGLGQSQIAVDSLDFKATDFGWKAVVGVRAVDLFGAEAEYVNLGRPHALDAAGHVSTHASGPAVFAIAYLPNPVPNLDLFGKAGIANIQQTASVSLGSGGSGCVAGITCDGLSTTTSEFAWGLGAQLRYGSLGVRAEVEQYRASGGNLNFATVGIYWSFF
jgi:hypothetical protein